MGNSKINKVLQTVAIIFIFFNVFLFFENQLAAQTQGWCIPPYPVAAPPPPPPPPPCCNGERCYGSPVSIAGGNYTTSAEDLKLPTRGWPLTMKRTYNSNRVIDGLFGNGWTSNLTTRLVYSQFINSWPASYIIEADIVMPNGKLHRYYENPDGLSFVPPMGKHHSLIRNQDLTFTLKLEFSKAYYRFMSDGRLDFIVDEYGNTIDYEYDVNNGKLIKIKDLSGSARSLNITYGADGRISDVTDSLGRNVHYGYVNGNMTAVTDPLRNSNYPAGRQTKYEYIAGRFGQLMSTIKKEKPSGSNAWIISTMSYESATDRLSSYTEEGETYTYTYQPNGDPHKTEKRDSANNVWIFTYDDMGFITRIDPPVGTGGGSKDISYYSDGSIDTVTDETGMKTKYEYSNGFITAITRDFQGSQAVKLVYTYDPDPDFPGRITSVKPVDPNTGNFNPDWEWQKFDYYQDGSTAPGALYHAYRVKNDGINQETLATYTYNSNGQMLSEADGTGAITNIAYEADGDLQSITYPKNSDTGLNPVYQFTTDAAGRMIAIIDPLNHTTSYTYDEVDRILTVTIPKPSPGSPLNFITTYSYDNFVTGLLFVHQTDPNGRITKQGYDEFDHSVQRTDSYNKTTTYAYTKGLLTSITDANNYITSYSYNALRRLTAVTFSDSTVAQYSYYPDGLLQIETDRLNPGQQITYTYDAFKRLKQKTYPVGSIVYTYTGQKLTFVDDTVSGDDHTYTYDASYRVSSDQGSLATINYSSYNAADQVLTMSRTGGPTTDYTYYADGSLKTINWTRDTTGQFTYTYTLTGMYSQITFPNGQHRDYSYDDQGRLLQINNTHPSAGNLATYAYAYDYNYYSGQNTMLGQRSSLTATVPYQNLNSGLFKYYYDDNYQLKQTDYPGVPYGGAQEILTYDDIGNRTSYTSTGTNQTYTYQTITPNPKNWQRLLSDGVKNYSYNNNGSITGDGTNTYTWDYENRLKGITQLNTTYKYDYLGRRIGKTVSSSTTNYIYDKKNLIAESGAATADYVFGPGIDEPLAIYRNSTVYYYDIDGLGSVVLLNNTGGTVQDSYLYDSWGKLGSSTVGVANPFGYTAREFADNSLLYYRARYYMPSVGRFSSEDPLKLVESSLYAYVNNFPINFVDPEGVLKCVKYSGIQYLDLKDRIKKRKEHRLGEKSAFNLIIYKGICPPGITPVYVMLKYPAIYKIADPTVILEFTEHPTPEVAIWFVSVRSKYVYGTGGKAALERIAKAMELCYDCPCECEDGLP